MKFMTFLQLLLTGFVIFVIFSIATDDQVLDKVQTKMVDKQMMATTGVSASEALTSSHEGASGETDVKKLEAMAKGEAAQMIRDGDVSAYQKEIEKNPLLKKIIGKQ